MEESKALKSLCEKLKEKEIDGWDSYHKSAMGDTWGYQTTINLDGDEYNVLLSKYVPGEESMTLGYTSIDVYSNGDTDSIVSWSGNLVENLLKDIKWEKDRPIREEKERKEKERQEKIRIQEEKRKEKKDRF